MSRHGDRAVHQLVASLAYGDAVGQHALAIRDALRGAGFASEIYADRTDTRLASLARPSWRYAREASSPESVCLFHFAIRSTAGALIHSLPDRLVLVYHNVTPAEFFLGWSRELATLCHHGRRELRAFAPRSELAFGVSEFNRRELEAAGFRRTGVLPLSPALEAPARPRAPVLGRLLDDGRDNILFVGRLAPNKRIEDLIRVFAVYQRWVQPASRLLLVGDARSQPRYVGALQRYVDDLRLDEVVFAGHLDDDDLRSCYAAAHVFLCLSEHEGFGVPLLEAMAFGVPVVAYAAAAVPETLRGGGVLLHDKRPDVTAELLFDVVHDQALRRAVLATQARTLAGLRPASFAGVLLERLEPVLGGRP
jgi:glycosyltransferase involved in cell wall biosynthesis